MNFSELNRLIEVFGNMYVLCRSSYEMSQLYNIRIGSPFSGCCSAWCNLYSFFSKYGLTGVTDGDSWIFCLSCTFWCYSIIHFFIWINTKIIGRKTKKKYFISMCVCFHEAFAIIFLNIVVQINKGKESDGLSGWVLLQPPVVIPLLLSI